MKKIRMLKELNRRPSAAIESEVDNRAEYQEFTLTEQIELIRGDLYELRRDLRMPRAR